MADAKNNEQIADESEPETLEAAVDDMRDSVAAFTYDGDRSSQDHLSGEPVARKLVLGDDDPRDASLAEKPLSEDVAWTGRIFNVNRLQVKLPDGREAVRDVVRHPGAVAIVALTEEGRICLVRQYRTALGRVTVEIPAGKLDPGEDPLECAGRELREETGMVAEKMAFLTTIASSATSSSTFTWRRGCRSPSRARTPTSSSTSTSLRWASSWTRCWTAASRTRRPWWAPFSATPSAAASPTTDRFWGQV